MFFPEDVWKIVKSYLMDKNEVNRRLFIKHMNENSVFKQDLKWKRILLLSKFCSYESERESEED